MPWPITRKERIQQQAESDRKERESERYQATISALHSITHELNTDRQRQETAEAGQVRREWWTIIALFTAAGAAVLALIASIIIAKAQHQDTVDALTRADRANRIAQKAAEIQHDDTATALIKADEANRIAQDTAKRQLRAYVFMDAASPEHPLKAGKPFAVILEMKNFGQTPAYDLTGWMATVRDKYPHVGRLQVPADGQREIGATLLPPNTFWRPRVDVNELISDDDTAAILRGTQAIYIWGEIIYTDAFKTRRCTIFSYEFSGENARRGMLRSAVKGNSEAEDCDAAYRQ